MASPLTPFEDELESDPIPGQEEAEDGYFSLEDVEASMSDHNEDQPGQSPRRKKSLSIMIPPSSAQSTMAFAALHYLPMPVLVLNSSKAVVLANEAMIRLLGIDTEGVDDTSASDGDSPSSEKRHLARSSEDMLQGLGLGELGLDMLSNGKPVFVSWESVLQNVVEDGSRAQEAGTTVGTPLRAPSATGWDDATPTENRTPNATPGNTPTPNGARGASTQVHDAVVDVVFTTVRDPQTGLPLSRGTEQTGRVHEHVHAKMIISVWTSEREQHFTLTFTAAASTDITTPQASSAALARSSSRTNSIDGSEKLKTITRIVSGATPSYQSGLPSSNSSSASSRYRKGYHPGSGHGSNLASPYIAPLSEFPPQGPPEKSSHAAAPSIFAKSSRLKDAILNSMSIPAYALWKDSSFGVPNVAALKMIFPWMEEGDWDNSETPVEFLSRYILYRDDFREQIPLEELPVLRLIRDQVPFEGFKCGMYSAKDGSRLIYEVSGRPLLGENGDFLGGLVLFNDVTGFTMAINHEKQRNERQFEVLTNMIPQMIWRTTPDGSHDHFNQRWYEYTGLTQDQSLGREWIKAFHPDDVAIAGERWAECLRTGEDYTTEYRCKNAKGEWRWFLGKASPLRDDNGTIVNWFGSCTDIHDVVMAREEAKQTRLQLERVIEHGRIALWVIDKDLRFRLVEGEALGRSNDPDKPWTKSRLIGMKLEDYLRHEEGDHRVDIFMAPARRILFGEVDDITIEVEVGRRGRWFRFRFSPLLRQDRTGGIEGDSFIDGVVCVGLDVTDHKRAEAEIKARERENSKLAAQSEAAKEASKMKSQFLANMSHEIRTPIAGVIGMSELLLDDDSGDLTTDQRECAENIQRSANGLLTVINDILDFSKVESGRLDIEEVQFDLSVVVQDINKMLSFAAERKGLTYIDDIPELRSWKVMGDPGRLRQVITNLLTNSIKFTSEGSVTMRMKVRKETDDILEVEFIVEDTGIGIEDEIRQKLFKPFSQADSSTARRFGGTGLGLTISKNLVELMHGKIDLESKLGVGTKASFWIPFNKAPYQSGNAPTVSIVNIPDRLQSDVSVSRPASDHSVPLSPLTPGHRLSRMRTLSAGPTSMLSPNNMDSSIQELGEAERSQTRVLVVEDNPVNQQIALRTIKKLGFPVKAVWNGQEALEYLQNPSNDRPAPDIILMDVQMPIMDGYRATSIIRSHAAFVNNPDLQATPIVAMTASAIQGDREKCQESGMDDYLAKPVKKPNLERMLVKWAIEGKRKRAELRSNGTMPLQSPQNATPSFATSTNSHESAKEQLTSKLERLEFVRRAAVERSTETADQWALRQQQAEEKAITLRDDALLNSAEGPRAQVGRGLSSEAHEKREKEDDEHGHSLTVANMEKLAASEATPLRKLNTRLKLAQDGTSSMAVTNSSAVDAASTT